MRAGVAGVRGGAGVVYGVWFEVGSEAGGLGVEEVLEFLLEGTFAALEVQPDSVWLGVVVSVSGDVG